MSQVDTQAVSEAKVAPEVIDVDSVFEQIGEFGFYQAAIFVIVSLVAVIPALTAYSYIYNGATPDHRCKLPGYANDTFEIQSPYHQELVNTFIPPPKAGTVDFKYDNCHLKAYDHNSSVLSNDSYHLTTCAEYVYSREYYQDTVVTRVRWLTPYLGRMSELKV